MRVTDQGTRLREVSGRRSSQEAGKGVFAEAARTVDPSLAERIEGEAAWRKRYLGPVRHLVELGARSDEAALRIAREGLAAVDRRVELARGGGALPLGEALRSPSEPPFRTEVVTGAGRGATELAIPYRGEKLSGDPLRRQLDAWVEAGTIEPSAREAVEKVVANPDWLDLSDRRFVLLGAASEMCALPALCEWGADVIAVDLPRRPLWERILGVARRGRGRVHVPVRASGDLEDVAGADLLHDAPEIRAWLDGFDGEMTVADDTYADGSRFLLLAATTDALMRDLASRPGTSLAYLATPTDVFAVPEEVVTDVARRRRRGRAAVRALSGGALYRPNYRDLIEGDDGRRWGISDCLVPQQGANYALAKNLQRWRAMIAREEGILVSANVAPATRTRSVMKNRALAAAYRGAGAFGVEVFEPETSRWLMAALLVHDLRDGGESSGGHPYDLFVQGAAHGGIWRLGYEPRSVLPLAVVRGLAGRSR